MGLIFNKERQLTGKQIHTIVSDSDNAMNNIKQFHELECSWGEIFYFKMKVEDKSQVSLRW